VAQPRRTPNTLAKLKTIAAPVLALAGGADLISPPAIMRIWAEHISNCEWAEIGEAGHSIAWEQPELFNRHVLAFIAKH
jgi:pimeloyl-ACP methyl ester carboxylesterase